MNGRVGVTIVIVAVLLVGTGPVAAATGTTDTAQSEPFAIQQDQIDADEVRMDVSLQPNGTAEWTLEFWVQLDDEESTTAFESLQADIRDDPANYTQSFADRMDDTVAAASDATGREMSVDGVAVDTERRSFAREYGVVRYTFRWHGFAAVEGDELRAGEAIEGLYLDDGTRLLVEWPAAYEPTSITPDPDDRRDNAAIWRGRETDFVSGEPRIVVTAGGAGPSSTLLATAAVVVVGLGAVGVWWYRSRTPTVSRPNGESTGRGSESDPETDSDSSPARGPDAAAESTGGTGGGASSATAAPGESGTSTAPDPELLSNEEQVLRLIRDRGGRMKQQTVVEELGWTDAKTSKVVTGLREEDKLESFRLGRENVLSLPEDDGADADEDDTGGDGTGGNGSA